MGRARLLLLAIVTLAACEKVPLTDVNAGFALADAAWFEDEETLFFFWHVDAEQGLGPESQMELMWKTDDAEQPWAAISGLTSVHEHVKADCGITSLCGSTSVRVVGRPVQVGLRLRYHRDSALTLTADVALHLIGSGPAFSNRSLAVYGVLDDTNTQVQWRARHQFPALRNEEVQALGLRRKFEISEPRHGTIDEPFGENAYGYGLLEKCPDTLEALDWPPIGTNARAVFDPNVLPLSATASAVVCANSQVSDARGHFDAIAFARKNPEVAAAFPSLHSPIHTNTQVGFRLQPCNREISEPHRAMQEQRLLMEGTPEICIDDWDGATFESELVTRLRSRIDQVRIAGNDMVLVLTLHQDVGDPLAAVIERALAQVLLFERDKSSPRVSGAFVFDSLAHKVTNPAVRRLVLWCPANLLVDDLDKIPSAAERSCALQPDLPDLKIGPFKFGQVPILPTRKQYLKFIDTYSEAQAGRTVAVSFRAPERTPVSENVDVGDFGVATFFNSEQLTASPSDAFSFCPSGDATAGSVVFRIAALPDVLPLSALPELHATAPQSSYSLGLFWDFPYLMRLNYEVVVAGAASAYGLTIPFGIALPSEAFYGAPLWEKGEFDLSHTLLRCSRFCDHPTFDSAGVYNVAQGFRLTYRDLCYRPRFPVPTDGGFPRDP